MIHLIPIITFLLFALYVEGSELKRRLDKYASDIDRAFGHADRIYRGERGVKEGKRICKQLS